MSDSNNEACSFQNHEVSNSYFLTSFQRKLLLKNLHNELRPEYRRRIEIILFADAGLSQTQICAKLGCSQETARYWMTLTHMGQAHHWNTRPVGRPKTVNEPYLDRLKELINHSPREYGYAFQCWTAQWLSKQLAKEFEIEISDRHVNRLLKQMGLSSQQRREKVIDCSANPKDDRIVIENLSSSASSECSELWQFKTT